MPHDIIPAYFDGKLIFSLVLQDGFMYVLGNHYTENII